MLTAVIVLALTQRDCFYMGYSKKLSRRFGEKPSLLHCMHLKTLLFQYVQYLLTLTFAVSEDTTLTESSQSFASSE